MENNTINFEPYAIFDYSEFPLVRIQLTSAEITNENFEAYVKETGNIYKKGYYVLILDTTETKYVSAKYRLMQGNALKLNKNNIAEFSLGMALISPSMMQRILLEAIFMIKPYPSESRVCKTEEEAEEWARQILEREKEKFQSQENSSKNEQKL